MSVVNTCPVDVNRNVNRNEINVNRNYCCCGCYFSMI